MADLVDSFAAHQRMRGFSAATIARRSDTLRLLERFTAPTALAGVSRDDLEAFLACRPSASTRHAYRSDVRAFFSWAAARGLVESSPAADLDPIRVPRRLPRPVDASAALGAARVGPRRTRQMVALAVFAGLRRGEIAALHTADVWLDTSPAVLVVRNGKGGKDRTVPLHPELAKLLNPSPPPGPWFRSPAGGPILPASAGRTVTEHLRRCGISATTHQLRHTFGTELARAAGGDMLVVSSLMGHEDISTSAGYCALSPDRATPIVGGMFAAA